MGKEEIALNEQFLLFPQYFLLNQKIGKQGKGLKATILNLTKMEGNSSKGYKTLWEKKKLIATDDLSFSQGVSKRVVLQPHKNKSLFGKE